MKKRYLIELIAALYALLFVYAASSKLLEFQKFRVQLGKSPLLTAHADWFAVLVPSLEIGLALLLALPFTRKAALYGSFSLMVMFTTYIVIILHFSDYIPCSCGGILENMSWSEHLVFNICFILPAALGILLYPVTKKGPL